MRMPAIAILFLLLAFTAYAEGFDTITAGTIGKVIIGEAASGGGEYFIGLGRAVNVSGADTVVLAIGEAVNVSGDVNGDLYVIGRAVNISGNVRGAAYIIAEQATIEGDVNNVAFMGREIRVTGTVENNLSCDCEKIVVEKGASVSMLKGEAENTVIEGKVLQNTVKIVQSKKSATTTEEAGNKAKEWITGVISMLVIAFVLRRWRKWAADAFKDWKTYAYGIAFIATPAVVLIVFLLSLALTPFGVLFTATLGLEIAAIGAWLAALMAAGIPVYDTLGGTILKKWTENYYANVALGYTLCFIISLVFPVWWIVAIAGSGALIKTVITQG